MREPTITVEDAFAKSEENPLSMHEWHASEGGHKCVYCNKYRKRSDLLIYDGKPDIGHYSVKMGDGTVIRISECAQPVCRSCLAKEFGGGGPGDVRQ